MSEVKGFAAARVGLARSMLGRSYDPGATRRWGCAAEANRALAVRGRPPWAGAERATRGGSIPGCNALAPEIRSFTAKATEIGRSLLREGLPALVGFIALAEHLQSRERQALLAGDLGRVGVEG